MQLAGAFCCLELVDLQIRGINVQNALIPTDIQDYLQYKYWISLLFMKLSYRVKTDFKIIIFIDRNVSAFFYVPLYACSFGNAHFRSARAGFFRPGPK